MNNYRITTDAPTNNIFRISGTSEMDAMINWIAFCLEECADGRVRDFGEIVKVEKIKT